MVGLLAYPNIVVHIYVNLIFSCNISCIIMTISILETLMQTSHCDDDGLVTIKHDELYGGAADSTQSG